MVYPVGMTEVQLRFMHKIAYNFLVVDQIYPKFDTGICLCTPNTCAEFQPDWSLHMQVIAIFAAKCTK